MADVSVAKAGFGAPAPPGMRQVNVLCRHLRDHATIALLMALPLIAMISGLAVWSPARATDLSMPNKRTTTFVGTVAGSILGEVLQWGKTGAATPVAALPPAMTYAVVMDCDISGPAAGAIKG